MHPLPGSAAVRGAPARGQLEVADSEAPYNGEFPSIHFIVASSFARGRLLGAEVTDGRNAALGKRYSSPQFASNRMLPPARFRFLFERGPN